MPLSTFTTLCQNSFKKVWCHVEQRVGPRVVRGRHVVPRGSTVERRGLGVGGVVTWGQDRWRHVEVRGVTCTCMMGSRVGSRGATGRKETDELEEDRIAGHGHGMEEYVA